jgi:hypothetical protein
MKHNLLSLAIQIVILAHQNGLDLKNYDLNRHRQL